MTRFTLASIIVVVVALLCTNPWVAAKGPPVADFPSFIPFNILKTGDVAVDKIGNVYINVTDLDGHAKIWTFSPDGEGPEEVADLGPGTAYGLALNANGEIYAALRDGIYSKLYRVSRNGTRTELPGTDNIVWANALAFDQRGNLYVTETFSLTETGYGQGGIWRIPPGGDAEIWLRDDLLTGFGTTPPVGANGIAYYKGDLYVVNTFKFPSSKVVRIPILPDGSPGQPEVWAEIQEVPESPLAGFQLPAGDGIALDVHGNVYITVVNRAAVVKINAGDLSQETIAVLGSDPDAALFAPLDTPNTLAFGTGKGGRQNLFVTNNGTTVLGIRVILKIEAGVPGVPLP